MRRYCLVPRAVVVSGRHLVLVRDTAGVRPPSPGRWHLPGGEVLESESPQKAAERIVKLRTGLPVEIRGCLDALARRGADPASGRPTQLLHLFFLCRPAPESDPALLPDGGRYLAGVDLEDGLDVGTDDSWSPAGRLTGPPGGADWGWTDLESGLAALRHDVVGEWVVDYLRRALEGGA